MKYRHPSFFIFKFDSDRIHEYNYKINQTFSQGQKNGEIIRMADSQILRTLRKIKGIEFSQEKIYELVKNKQQILAYKRNYAKSRRNVRKGLGMRRARVGKKMIWGTTN